MTRRALEVLLFDARNEARDAGGDVLELLVDLEPAGELDDQGLEASRARFADALSTIAAVRRERGDAPGAELAWENALELSPAPSPERLRVLIALGDVRLVREDAQGAVAALSAAEQLAAALGVSDDADLAALRERLGVVTPEVEREQAKDRVRTAVFEATRQGADGETAAASLAVLLRELEQSAALREEVRAGAGPEDKALLANPAFLSALRQALEPAARDAADDASQAAPDWLGARLQALAAAGQLQALESTRHYLRTERDDGSDRRLLRVAIRVERRDPAPEVVLEVDAQRLASRPRRIRFVHRIGLDGRLVRSQLFHGRDEYHAEVHGTRLVVTRANGKPVDDDPPWGAATTFHSIALFLLPQVAALGPPPGPVHAPFVLDLWGWDDYSGTNTLGAEGWDDAHGQPVNRRSVDAAGMERWWVRRKQITFQQIDAAEAERLLTAVVVIPDDDEALRTLAEQPDAAHELLYAMAGRVEQSEQRPWLERAAAAGSGRACQLLSERESDPAAARAWLERGVELAHAGCMTDFANALSFSDDASEAARAEPLLRRAVELGSGHARHSLEALLFTRAQAAANAEAWDEAARLLEESSSLEARNGVNRSQRELLRAEIALGRGDPAAAVAIYGRAIEAERAEFARTRRLLARVGQGSEFEFDPGDSDGVPVELYRRRADAYLQLDRPEAAAADLTQAVANGDIGSRVPLARLLIARDRRDLALAELDAAVRDYEAYPAGTVAARRLRAQLHADAGDLDAALADLTVVNEFEATAPSAFKQALLQTSAGQFDAAEETLRWLLSQVEHDYAAILACALGQETPPLQTTLARGDWVADLARFAAGQVPLAQTLALADQAETEEGRQERRCEVLGYAGLLAERAGELRAAMTHYQACLATRVHTFVEYDLARHRFREVAVQLSASKK